MLSALAEDFGALPGVEVAKLPAAPLDPERALFRRFAAESDWSLIIAPEFDGILLALCREVESVGGKLLGPSSSIVDLTADKWATCHHLERFGVPTPRTWLADDPEMAWHGRFQCVWKPRRGAGSLNISFLHRPKKFEPRPGFLLQEYVPGTAASVAFLTGPSQIVPLLSAYQDLSDNRRFEYQGGRLPIPEPLAQRAARLAESAVRSLSAPCGYLGVDLVLGDAADGSGDSVIEINPRLTTSYVGLRALAEDNIAAAMLSIAAGQPIPALRWKPGHAIFTSDGQVNYLPPPR